jgi:2'-5' RNA ligase
MSACLVVVLHGEPAAAIQALWSQLHERWGIERSHPSAEPHLTLATVHGDPEAAHVRAVLEASVVARPPFTVTSAGYGVFLGHGSSSPVLHLAVTRTPGLSRLQASIVELLAGAGYEVDGLSEPEHWRPHVTLGDHALTPGVVGEAVRHLVAGRHGHRTLDVDNVSMLANGPGLAFQLALRGATPGQVPSEQLAR